MKMDNLMLKFSNESSLNLATTTTKMPLSEIFSERKSSYFNEFKFFIAHFNSIPNFILEIDINCKNARAWFSEHHQSDIKDIYYNKRYFNGSKKPELDDVIYFLYEDLMVDFDTNQSIVRFFFRKTELPKVETITNAIRKFKNRKQRIPKISLLVNSVEGVIKKSMEITKPKLNIEDNYNHDFREIHQTIFKRLSRKNDRGMVLLHGKPGTGKTSYIRYLISSVKKSVIFLPLNMASAITNPDLISILIDNPNSVIVIEDAENIIIDREKNEASPVSALLNIADGLLADCLNIQIICSFNTDISKIDSALMRKGRLIAKYEFKELEANQAQRLSNKLGFNTEINQPMTLASIYNQDEKSFQQKEKRNPIGFRNDINKYDEVSIN